ncbi:MAG: hypothetical protein RL491_516, partial [Bacteroidota bacterium]
NFDQKDHEDLDLWLGLFRKRRGAYHTRRFAFYTSVFSML